MRYKVAEMEHKLCVEVFDLCTYTQLAFSQVQWGVDKTAVEKYLAALVKHITYVREAGTMIGVNPEQLDMHDSSKFSLEELPQYARQYGGDAGDPDGYAQAWLHHIHHNPHHWQHWMFPDNYTPANSRIEHGVLPMPHKYVKEMVADWMGASMAYTGSWDMTGWLHENMPRIHLHSETTQILRNELDMLGYADVVYTQRWGSEAK